MIVLSYCACLERVENPSLPSFFLPFFLFSSFHSSSRPSIFLGCALGATLWAGRLASWGLGGASPCLNRRQEQDLVIVIISRGTRRLWGLRSVPRRSPHRFFRFLIKQACHQKQKKKKKKKKFFTYLWFTQVSQRKRDIVWLGARPRFDRTWAV